MNNHIIVFNANSFVNNPRIRGNFLENVLNTNININ